MVQEYKIIHGDKEEVHSVQIEVKKSKFITYLKKIESEEEAITFINQIKKQHYNASHNCSAFILGENKEIVRSSDDGEPQGTAGRPMLDVLMGSELVNVVAVVTRYFGGTQLGRGGLVRAYGGAVQAGLECVPTAIMTLGHRIEIHTDYNTIGNILHKLNNEKLPLDDSEYTDIIKLHLTVEKAKIEELEKDIIEISGGKSRMDILEELYFPKKL